MRTALALFVVLAACDDSTPRPPDAGSDAGVDSGVDAGHDAGSDAKVDSGFDAGHDSGMDSGPMDAGVDSGQDAAPSCQCASGPCCDGCYYRPNTHVCRDDEAYAYDCVGASICPGLGNIQKTRYESQRCSGFSDDCTGSLFGDHAIDTDCSISQGFPTYSRCAFPDGGGPTYCTWGPNCVTEGP